MPRVVDPPAFGPPVAESSKPWIEALRDRRVLRQRPARTARKVAPFQVMTMLSTERRSACSEEVGRDHGPGAPIIASCPPGEFCLSCPPAPRSCFVFRPGRPGAPVGRDGTVAGRLIGGRADGNGASFLGPDLSCAGNLAWDPADDPPGAQVSSPCSPHCAAQGPPPAAAPGGDRARITSRPCCPLSRERTTNLESLVAAQGPRIRHQPARQWGWPSSSRIRPRTCQALSHPGAPRSWAMGSGRPPRTENVPVGGVLTTRYS